jgi:hypothetical protein
MPHDPLPGSAAPKKHARIRDWYWTDRQWFPHRNRLAALHDAVVTWWKVRPYAK